MHTGTTKRGRVDVSSGLVEDEFSLPAPRLHIGNATPKGRPLDSASVLQARDDRGPQGNPPRNWRRLVRLQIATIRINKLGNSELHLNQK